jgi:predicted SnoaL-like aldol condensation-catalyzing enzyme
MSDRGILETENLRIATEMYETVLARLDPAEVDRYFASDYIQHGSLASDGRDALKGFLEQAERVSGCP